MLHEVFYWVMNMSIIASVYGILLYFLRFIKGCPKIVSYLLWAVVLVRFLCPFGISSEYSLLGMISKVTGNSFVKTVLMDSSEKVTNDGSLINPVLSLTNSIQTAKTYHPVTYKTNILEHFFKAASIVWLIVACSAFIAVIFLYILTKTELKKATYIKDNIYEGAMVNTPTVYGLIKPRIVLPVGIEKEHLKYILMHEKIHIRRLDNVWRMLAIFTACIHWFNPLSWIFLKCFLKDCEFACDEAAVKKMNKEERKNYARTLLAYTSSDRTVFSSAFGSSKVKVRIQNVLSYQKLTLFSTLCFVGLVAVITFLLLTNAAS